MASLEQRLQAVEQAIQNSRITPNLPTIANIQGDEIVPIWSPGAQDTVQYPLADITGGGAISNDVIPIFKRVDGIDYSSSTPINEQIANILNNDTPFSKGQNQLLLLYTFRILSGESSLTQRVTREYYFFTGEKGTYGNNATQINASNVVYFVTDRDDSRESQIYNLGEIGDTQTIQDAVNSTGPYDPSVAQLIVFRALRNGITFDYVYIGQQVNLIGLNEEQTIIGDYLNLNDVTPDPPPASQDIDTELDINSSNAVTNQAITLAIQNVENQRQSYDEFLYKSFTGDITAYSVTEDFELINNNGTYYLLIKDSLEIDLQNTRISVNVTENILDLTTEDISNNNYVGFQVNSSIAQGLSLDENYTFNFWRRVVTAFVPNDSVTEVKLSPEVRAKLNQSVGAGGYAGNVYYTNIDSTTVPAYKKLSYEDDASPTIIDTIVNNNEVLIQDYIFDGDVLTDQIPSGLWVFNTFCEISATQGVTQIRHEVFARTSGGVETVLFSVDTEELLNTTYEMITTGISKPSYSVNPTDRIGIKLYAKTTRTSDVTVSIQVGNGNASYVTSPLQIRHSQLRGREEADSHPISAITNLQTSLDSKDLKRTNLTVTKTNDTYTLQASDVDKRLFIPAPCTVIVPNGLAANLEFEGKQTGTGDVEFVAESGGTLNVNAAFQKFTEGEHAYWGIVTLGSDEADLLGTLKLSV